MENSIAKVFLESLLDRIVKDPNTGKHSLQGSISYHEIQAIHKASEILGRTSSSSTIESEANSSDQNSKDNQIDGLPDKNKNGNSDNGETTSTQSIQPDPELNLESLKFKQPEDDDVILCLDFGTAMSKAFASLVEDDEIMENYPLKIGKRDSPTGASLYPIPSSIWISEDGKIYLGEKAVALSLSDQSGNRQRFDSLKKELTMGLLQTSPDDSPLEKEINPTSVSFTKGDAITLYLAYLTDLTCSEMVDQHGKSRYVRRRFALPSWTLERKDWGIDTLSKMLSKAQIVSDTLHGRWHDGIPLIEAKAILDKVNNLSEFPDYLIGEGVTEPLAAGASYIRREENSRGMVIVVDIGAGTSDMALFVVVQQPERDLFNAWPVKKCNQSLHMAGDALDHALIKVISEKANIDKDYPDYQKIISLLRMQIRNLKEDLFKDGNCTFTLADGNRGTISLDDFLKRQEVQNFSNLLNEKFNDILKNVDRSIPDRLKSGGLTVVLTGGGANLPMVKKLAEGNTIIAGIGIQKNRAPLVPEAYADNSELSFVYPQLAVAIGGAMPDLMDEASTITEMPGLSARGWSIGRHQISGL